MKEFITKILWPIWGPINFIQDHFKATLFVVIVGFLFLSTESEQIKEPNLAKIYLTGEIANSEQFIESVKKAQDLKVKGVLLIIDSPGGAVAPSVEMSMAIKKLRNENIPVVAYAAGTMASGSYYAGIWSNKIIANPGSMIGSIGVIFQNADVSGLMNKVGVKMQTIKMGEYKEAGTPFRAWNKEEKEELNILLKSTYDMFIKDVATARKLDENSSNKFANARVFTAVQAKEAGLIDSMGSIFDAEKELAKIANVKDPIWAQKNKTEELMNKLVSETVSRIVQSATGMKAY